MSIIMLIMRYDRLQSFIVIIIVKLFFTIHLSTILNSVLFNENVGLN